MPIVFLSAQTQHRYLDGRLPALKITEQGRAGTRPAHCASLQRTAVSLRPVHTVLRHLPSGPFCTMFRSKLDTHDTLVSLVSYLPARSTHTGSCIGPIGLLAVIYHHSPPDRRSRIQSNTESALPILFRLHALAGLAVLTPRT